MQSLSSVNVPVQSEYCRGIVYVPMLNIVMGQWPLPWPSYSLAAVFGSLQLHTIVQASTRVKLLVC